jgi:RecA-family ATPase
LIKTPSNADLLILYRRGSINEVRPKYEHTSTKLNSTDLIHRYELSRRIHYYATQTKVWPELRLVSKTRSTTLPGQDSFKVSVEIACAMRLVGATPDEALAVLVASAHWRNLVQRGEHNDAEQFISNVYNDTLLIPLDPADWSREPKPEQEWLLRDLIPARKVSALYGAGAVGKTLLAQQLAICLATGKDFLGIPVKQGRVLLFLAEDEEDDAHRAFKTIATQYSVKLEELRGNVQIITRFGFDNALGKYSMANKGPTALFDQLLRIIQHFRPMLVVLDPLADLFEGNENDRSQVVQFLVGVAGTIVRETGSAVLICAHPSKEGERSGRGDSGSTSWNNKVRGRLLLRRVFNNVGQERDRNARVLEQVKTNFEPVDPISLRWSDGILVA